MCVCEVCVYDWSHGTSHTHDAQSTYTSCYHVIYKCYAHSHVTTTDHVTSTRTFCLPDAEKALNGGTISSSPPWLSIKRFSLTCAS